MPKRGIAFWSVFSAFDMNAKTRKTGDAANITVRVSQDGGLTAVTATNTPVEITTPAPALTPLGRYKVQITSAEALCNSLAIIPSSATANILCEDAEYEMDDPVGIRDIDIGVTDSGTGVSLADVQVEIWNVAENVLYIGKLTDGAGGASFGLGNGTYHVRMYRLGYTFTVPEVLVVTGDATVSYTGTEAASGSAPAGTQLLRGYLVLNSLTGNTGAMIFAAIAQNNSIIDHAVLSSQKTEDTAAIDGYFELYLAKGGTFNITARDPQNVVFYSKRITVTDDDTAWIDDYN
jgi:hypothetical protein